MQRVSVVANYRLVQDLVWARADTVVWFDLPRRVVMRQVLRRTIGRAQADRSLTPDASAGSRTVTRRMRRGSS